MLLVIGDSNADAACRLAAFPREGDDQPIDGFAWSSGGAGVNVATAFARLGGKARLLSRTGIDGAADIALAAAKKAHVHVSHVQRDPAHTTGVCIVIVTPDAERTFLSHRGANAHLEMPDATVWDSVERVHVCGHALLSGAQRTTTLSMLEEASKRGVPASLDLCLPLVREHKAWLRRQLSAFDVVLANEAELALFTLGDTDASDDRFDEAVHSIREAVSPRGAGAGTVVVKRGARGSVVVGGSATAVPAFKVTAIDSTGAGDAYVAAFLFATIAGQSPVVSACYANAVGALQTARAGSADVLPAHGEVAAFLDERGAESEGAVKIPPHPWWRPYEP
ncbi:MAG: carbohydrate kinase family protein [Polyangiaceae bacterium]